MITSTRRHIAICGLVRDCRQAVARNWQALQKLQTADTQISWVFVENDSVDGSREWLEELATKHPNVTILGKDLGELTIPASAEGRVMPGFSIRRISKMAFFRNLYLDHLKQQIGLENLDAVVVVDYDVYYLSIGHLKQCIEQIKPGKVITALGSAYRRMFSTHFYDCYAYRKHGNHLPQTYFEIDSQRCSLWHKFRSIKAPFQVDSNFNGCAVYPAAAFANSKYVVLPNNDPEVECYVEHVGLHAQMRADGIQIWLDPMLQVIYETPCSYWFSWLLRRIQKRPLG